MGLLASFLAMFFMTMHTGVKWVYRKLGLHVSTRPLNADFELPRNLLPSIVCALELQEHENPVRCGVVGGFLIGVIGILLPPTMFWGEFEINTLADNTRPLPHIWPRGGFWGLEPFYGGSAYPWWLCAIIGLTKLLAISITVLSGLICLINIYALPDKLNDQGEIKHAAQAFGGASFSLCSLLAQRLARHGSCCRSSCHFSPRSRRCSSA